MKKTNWKDKSIELLRLIHIVDNSLLWNPSPDWRKTRKNRCFAFLRSSRFAFFSPQFSINRFSIEPTRVQIVNSTLSVLFTTKLKRMLTSFDRKTQTKFDWLWYKYFRLNVRLNYRRRSSLRFRRTEKEEKTFVYKKNKNENFCFDFDVNFFVKFAEKRPNEKTPLVFFSSFFLYSKCCWISFALNSFPWLKFPSLFVFWLFGLK